MATAKLFKHGGSQAVRLPKDYRFDGHEVLVERRGDAVVLRPKPQLRTLADLARRMREAFPGAGAFPVRQQPKEQQKRDPRVDG
jgi:antitoxin VapB